MSKVTILQGHVLDRLREVQENSVHCVVRNLTPLPEDKEIRISECIHQRKPGSELGVQSHIYWGSSDSQQSLSDAGFPRIEVLEGPEHSMLEPFLPAETAKDAEEFVRLFHLMLDSKIGVCPLCYGVSQDNTNPLKLRTEIV